MSKTLLAIGAHYDDCAFGIPGILLQAVAKGYRVIDLSLIGDYRDWPPAAGRAPQLLEASRQLAHFHGIEKRFLDFASGRFHVNEATKLAVAKAVAEVEPDIAFMLWSHDRHPDHEAASALSKIALRQAGTIIGNASVKLPRQIYLYDNGPGHTIGFEPNTFVDVSDGWSSAMDWLGELMAWVRQKPRDESEPDPAVVTKTTLARYRGATCGAKYSEALWAMNTRPVEIV